MHRWKFRTFIQNNKVKLKLMRKLNSGDSMERLSLKQYRKMVEEIIEYKNMNGKMPDYIMVEGFEISKKVYIDMMERVNKFILEMGRSPRTVDIKSALTMDFKNIK
jgi:hypothetical protein